MNTYLSDKIRIISLITMVLLTYVHAYTFPSNVFAGEAWSLEGLNFALQYTISQGLARFRIPFFFILSGYFYFRALARTDGSFLAQFTKRARTIALPYVLWSLFGLALYALLQWPSAWRAFFPHNPVWGLSPMEVLEKVLINPIPYQLWFLRDLMVLFALAPLIFHTLRWLGIWTLAIPFITWSLEVDLVILANESLPFFTAGAWLALGGPRHEPSLGRRTRLAVVVSWFLLVLVKTVVVIFHSVDPEMLKQIHHLAVLHGLIAVWVGYDLVVKGRDMSNSLLARLAPHGFFLYAAHEPLLTLIKQGLFLYLGRSPLSELLVYSVAPILAMTVVFMVGRTLMEHAPRFYGLLTGGRGMPAMKRSLPLHTRVAA